MFLEEFDIIMNVNDRGAKKWTSIMLPEHVELLKQVIAEQDYKEKPILDDQQKAEFDMLLQCALHNNLTVEIQYFYNHDLHTVKDKLTMIDSMVGYLRLEKVDKLYFDDIIGVQIL